MISRQCFTFRNAYLQCLLTPQGFVYVSMKHLTATSPFTMSQTFQIPVVAVEQRVGTVPFTVHSRFISVTSSSPQQMKPLQRTQHVRKSCTRLFYTIASSQQIEANMILRVEKLDKQIIQYIFQYTDKTQLPLVLKDLHLYISD